MDTDADNDGLDDVLEGNDFDFNGMPDDDVTLDGADTDGDGLDDHFDSDNSSARGTSAYMGNGGSVSGDGTPGSITVVQHTAAVWGCPGERDWRCLPFVLECEIITFNATLQQSWTG